VCRFAVKPTLVLRHHNMASGARAIVSLKQPVLIPPIPDDDVYSVKGKVYAKFSYMATTRDDLIGYLNYDNGDDLSSHDLLNLKLCSSGDGCSIPAIVC